MTSFRERMKRLAALEQQEQATQATNAPPDLLLAWDCWMERVIDYDRFLHRWCLYAVYPLSEESRRRMAPAAARVRDGFTVEDAEVLCERLNRADLPLAQIVASVDRAEILTAIAFNLRNYIGAIRPPAWSGPGCFRDEPGHTLYELARRFNQIVEGRVFVPLYPDEAARLHDAIAAGELTITEHRGGLIVGGPRDGEIVRWYQVRARTVDETLQADASALDAALRALEGQGAPVEWMLEAIDAFLTEYLAQYAAEDA